METNMNIGSIIADNGVYAPLLTASAAAGAKEAAIEGSIGLKDTAIAALKETALTHPTLFPPAIKALTASVMVGGLTPAASVITNHVAKGHNMTEAFNMVMKKPFAGAGIAMAGTLSDAYVIFTAKGIVEKKLIEKESVDKESASALGYLAGSTLSTAINNPFEYGRIQMVTKHGSSLSEVFSKCSFKDLTRGFVPSMIRAGLSWSFGLTLGDELYNITKEYTGDSKIGYLANKSLGWTVGNFISSPFFNMNLLLKTDHSLKSISDCLRKLNVLPDPQKYDAAKYSHLNLKPTMRIMLMLPPKGHVTIEPCDTLRLRAFHFLKYVPTLWRGFPKAVPLIVATGSAIATAEKMATEMSNNDNNN